MNAKELAASANWGYLSEREVDVLHTLVKIIEPKGGDYVPFVVNLGAGFGTSSMAMAEARTIHLYSIDNNPGFSEKEKENFGKAGLEVPFQITANSHSDELLIVPPFDLVFVDADHREEEVQADIDKWIPLIKKGGIIAFHDYGHSNYPGVKIAVDRSLPAEKRIFLVDTLIAFRV